MKKGLVSYNGTARHLRWLLVLADIQHGWCYRCGDFCYHGLGVQRCPKCDAPTWEDCKCRLTNQ